MDEIGYLHMTLTRIENAGVMSWPLDIKYYSTPYHIFPAQIQSKPLLTVSELQHYCSFEVYAIFLQL